jgi:hypothetical protein
MDRPGTPETPNEFALGSAIRAEVKQYGGIAEFLRTHIAERTASTEPGVNDTYRGNLRQMERIAKAIAAPNGTLFEASGLKKAGAFYFGEVIGMEIGERTFESTGWSAVLHENLNDFYMEARKWTIQEEIQPTDGMNIGAVSASRDSSRALLTANLMLGQLDDETMPPLPDELMSICRDFAGELQLSDEDRKYVEYGYILVMRIFGAICVDLSEEDDANQRASEVADLEEAFEEVNADDEAHLGEMIDDIADWDILGMHDEP